MNKRDLATIGAWAAGTAVLWLVALVPTGLRAVGPDQPVKPLIGEAKLTVAGCALTAKLMPPGGGDGEARGRYKVGDKPIVAVQAVCTEGRPVRIPWRVRMLATSPLSAASRMPSIPSEIGREEGTLAVEPGQTKALIIVAKTPIPLGKSVMVTLEAGTQTLLTATLPVGKQLPVVALATPAKR